MRVQLCTFLLIALLPRVVFAYDFEVLGTYQSFDYAETFQPPNDVRATESQDNRSVSVQYFFGGIANQSGPLGEADFLAPASSVFFQVSDSDSRLALGAGSYSREISAASYSDVVVGFAYLHESSRWLTRFEYVESELNRRDLQSIAFTSDFDERLIALEVGKYLSETAFTGIIARRGLSTSTNRVQVSPTFVQTGLSFDLETWEVGLKGRLLLASDRAVSLGLQGQVVASRVVATNFLEDFWSGNVIVGASLYFGRTRSIGLLVDAEVGSRSATRSSATLFGEWFLRKSISVRMAYSTVRREGDRDVVYGADGDALSLDLLWRIGEL